MAYGIKYIYRFESVDGADYTIYILKNGYSGSALSRAMGGAPTLRRDANECICGTSLDFIAECAVDGEYEEFGQSDPFTFKVEVYNYEAQDPIWQGFISPEIYRAPDIAPPYDVNITATDGLGELKLHDFEPQGLVSLNALLSYLLGFTGLSLGLATNLDLAIPNSNAAYFLQDAKVNLDYLAGKSCYDALQAVLTSFHLSITQGSYGWMVNKETSVVLNSGRVRYYVGGSAVGHSVFHFGSMTDHVGDFWPVGNMTREYVAPRKRIVLTSDNHYNPNILSRTWTTGGGASASGSYYSLPVSGGLIKQTYQYFAEIRQDLVLTLQVRNVGSGNDPGTLGVYVIAKNNSLSYYLTNQAAHAVNPEKPVWVLSDSYCTYELSAPSPADTDDDYTTIEIIVPLYNIGLVATALEIQIFNNDALYPKRVYDVALFKRYQFKGFKKTVNIDSGARGEAPDVDLAITGIVGSNDYSGIEELQTGILRDANGLDKIETLRTGIFSNLDYLSLIARDYALSYVSPRVRLSGVLNVPVGTVIIPGYFIDDYDGTLYIVETFSWDLYHDECTVQMISLPASGLTVDDETIEEVAPTNAASGGSSSGGGGGGGGSTVSISGLLPTGTVIGTLTIDGTPNEIKASEVSVSNRNTNGTRILTLTIDGTDYDLFAPAGGGGNPDQLGIPAPLVKITLGDGGYDSTIRIWHPLLSINSDAEVVLMVKSHKTQSKHGSSRSESANVHLIRKGWKLARTYNGSREYVFDHASGSFSAFERLDYMRNYIIRYYTKVSGRSRSQMASLSYAAWATYSTANFGWERALNSHTRGRNRRMFGVAVRIPNPEFERAYNHQRSLSEHTQSIQDGAGNPVPRYIYSAVAPILAQITEQPTRIGGIALGLEVK